MAWLTNTPIKGIYTGVKQAMKEGYSVAKATAADISRNEGTLFTGIRTSFKPNKANMIGALAGAGYGAYDNRRDFYRGDYFKGIAGTAAYGAAGYTGGSLYKHFSAAKNPVGQLARAVKGGIQRGYKAGVGSVS